MALARGRQHRSAHHEFVWFGRSDSTFILPHRLVFRSPSTLLLPRFFQFQSFLPRLFNSPVIRSVTHSYHFRHSFRFYDDLFITPYISYFCHSFCHSFRFFNFCQSLLEPSLVLHSIPPSLFQYFITVSPSTTQSLTHYLISTSLLSPHFITFFLQLHSLPDLFRFPSLSFFRCGFPSLSFCILAFLQYRSLLWQFVCFWQAWRGDM